MPPSGVIVTLIELFRCEFTEPTWAKVVVLLWGTILARGRRTVTAALRQMGHDHDSDFSSYHHVFNRSVWSPLRLARRLTVLLIQTLASSNVRLTFVIDETLERRWGKRIRIRGHYRDPLASSKERAVAASGIRWIVLALIVTPPWSTKPWALPVLSVPSPTPKVSAQLGRRHKTIAEWARQIVVCLRRWLPRADLTVVGDQAYSVIELGLCCGRHGVRLIAPLRRDARLFAPPPPRKAGTKGRPRIVGQRLPNLEVVLTDPATVWEQTTVTWYDGSERTLEVATATALWYHNGHQPLPIRWVLTRDPQGRLEPRTLFCTCPQDSVVSILTAFIGRWTIETTFEEARAHLGIETQRQWSDRAIARETPCLLGLYSLVVLLGEALHREHPLTARTAAWYPKPQATFSDVLAAVRRHGWDRGNIRRSQRDPAYLEIPRSEWHRLLNAVCYSH
jgi:hypothetical protein